MKIKLKIVDRSIPDGCISYWDNFNTNAYERYLEAKEAFRIKKMKQQN